jgi:hypothetical protein
MREHYEFQHAAMFGGKRLEGSSQSLPCMHLPVIEHNAALELVSMCTNSDQKRRSRV